MSGFALLGAFGNSAWLAAGLVVAVALFLILFYVAYLYLGLWLQAKFSRADVSLLSLIGMSLRNIRPSTIVGAQVMARQAGLTIAKEKGKSTAFLEAHYLAGGDVNRVILAIIAAHRAGIDLDFDRAAAIDLSGRDLAEAVRTSIFPKVIDCPENGSVDVQNSQSAIAKNGIELRTHVRVTVRTNLNQLIGGATEETIIARVGQGIVSTIGSMESHEEALAQPNRISQALLDQGIQSNTAYEIVSIDVATINVGRNIGARFQAERAEADMRVAQANAELRRAEAVALAAEMNAEVTAKEAELIDAETCIPEAMAYAIRQGNIRSVIARFNEKRPKLRMFRLKESG